MSKLSKRAITLFVIATMVLSMLSAFIAVPVMADVYIDAELASGATSDAVWADDPEGLPGRGDVARLTIGTDWAQVRIFPATDLIVSDLDTNLAANLITYDYWIDSGSSSVDHPDIELRFEEVAGPGYVEIGIYAYWTKTQDVWIDDLDYVLDDASAATGCAHFVAWMVEDGTTGVFAGGTMDLDDILAAINTEDPLMNDYVLERIAIQVGYGQPATLDVYVDNICFDGDVYDLETFTSSEEFTIDFVTPGDVDYGDVLEVYGSGVTAGSEVIAYWDYAGGTLVHPLNNTEGNPDGSFDLEVTVPSDIVGDHYLWVRDVATGATVKSGAITMVPKIKLSPSSGLENDDVDIKGYGFAAESDIEIAFDPAILSDDGGVDADETDELGYFEYTFEVDTAVDGTYDVWAWDEDGNNDDAEFVLGASISIDPDEGPTGTIVTVEGRGWALGDIMTFRDKANPGTAIEIVDLEVITVGSTGRFSAEIVIPELGNEGDYDIEAVGSITPNDSDDAFELLGLPEIVVTPTYGTPGKIITVKGYNFTQIADTEVTIKLGTEDLIIAETNSDGTFEDTFISPAVEFETYDVEATDDYGLFATDPFKVGLIALIINPVYGEAGTELSITGIGFAPSGEYNVTFGTILYEEYGSGVSSSEAISDIFYVPNVLTGIYDITITDEDDNAMTVEFRVTAVTEVTLDPAMAPNTYNVTIEGINFADKELEEVEFVLYNATDEWDMDVWQNQAGNERVETCDDGNFTAWWLVLDEDDLSLGDYTINVTGYDDFFLQIPFSVVEARVSVAPRKALFDRGDTIQFDVKNDFDFDESYMKIWDPDDNLYWETVEFADWVKSGDLYTVPYYMQTSGGNPMELSQDAPLGMWFYVFYETGTTQLTNGTFEVGPSAESLLTEQIEALSEELGIDIDTLRTVIDDLGIDMDEAVSMMAEDIAAAVSGMGADIAGLSEDLDDAVTGMQDDIDDMGTKMDSIETMVDDISETSGDAQQAANDAKTAAEQATEAAEANQQATSGLTGLVYGAIGASLIAALAAIVSLMQISRRIAG